MEEINDLELCEKCGQHGVFILDYSRRYAAGKFRGRDYKVDTKITECVSCGELAEVALRSKRFKREVLEDGHAV